MYKSVSSHSILVVDDDVGMLNLVEKKLNRLGFLTTCIRRGGEALSWLQDHPVDLILLDYQLPDMTGEELIMTMGEAEIRVPFIMITGHGGEKISVEMMKLGAQDYLVKNSMLLDKLPTIINEIFARLEQEEKLAITKEKLRKSEESFRLLAENATDLISRQTTDGTLLYVSPACKSLLGIEPDDMIGRFLFEFCHEEDIESIQLKFEDIKYSKQEQTLIFRLNRYDNETVWVETMFKPICDSMTNEIEEIQAASRSIAERMKLEFELNQAHKMEAVGVLAAGIAHEINTPMQFIKDNTCFVLKSMEKIIPILGKFSEINNSDKELIGKDSDLALIGREFAYIQEQIPLALSETLEGIDHVIDITSAMREFSHSGVSKNNKKLSDINQNLKTTAILARNEIKYVAELCLNLSPDLPEIYCSPDALNQVFLNLLVNAAHSISEKNEANGERKGKINVTTNWDKDNVSITFTDTGNGMSEEVKQRIFEPFFTTKDVGRGTGMGMSIVHEIIVNKHNGKIVLDSKIGLGTKFKIVLPIIVPKDQI